MNHAELVKHIAVENKLTQSQVKGALNSLAGFIAQGLKTDAKFELKGVGTISTIDTPERQGRNPATGEALIIQAGKRIKLKASKALKDAVA
jgi:DNA-binding protein HU-beta